MFFISDTSSDSSDEELKPTAALERKLIRQKSNIFNLPDDRFQSYFRLNKTAFRLVLEIISPNLRSGIRSSSIAKSLRLAATLRFLAEGSFQLSVGTDFNLGLSQPIVSKILSETLDALEMAICPQWLQFEMTEAEKNEAKTKFLEETGFPGVIGCVDGVHIKIIGPKREEQHLYLNHKYFYSINVMMICDHKMRIRFVDAENAGSVHDSSIWNASKAKRSLQQSYNVGERNSWLLGDAEYPLEPYLITPYRSATDGSAEAIFNAKHDEARKVMAKTIALLKSRFCCLLGTRQLHYKPGKAAKIVNVCAALHNICLEYGLDVTSEDTDGAENSETDVPVNDEELKENTEAAKIRDEIKQSFL